MSFDDPIRLRAGGSPELRELLRSVAADAPTALEVATLTAALAPAIHAAAASTAVGAATSAARAGAGTVAGTGIGVTTAAGLGLKASIVIATIGASVVGGTVAWQRTRAPDPRPAMSLAAVELRSPVTSQPRTNVAVPSSVDSAPTVSPPDVAPAPAVIMPSIGPTPQAPQRPAGTSVRRTRASAPPATAAPPITQTAPPAPVATPSTVVEAAAALAPPPTPPPRERDLLLDAGAALRSGDAQRALELTASHAAYYPNGMFTEELEVIAIEALVRLGHGEAANERFRQFVTHYPQSGYLQRLQRLFTAGSQR